VHKPRGEIRKHQWEPLQQETRNSGLIELAMREWSGIRAEHSLIDMFGPGPESRDSNDNFPPTAGRIEFGGLTTKFERQ
jgi:hypothetical protein